MSERHNASGATRLGSFSEFLLVAKGVSVRVRTALLFASNDCAQGRMERHGRLGVCLQLG